MLIAPTFVVGETYNRVSDLHERFGGSRQSGIAPSANSPVIFLFTGKTGGQYGYEDGWVDGDVFVYTGEGQVGDMEFTRGNRAIRDHALDGKELLLFEALGKSQPVRFMGSFACPSWEFGTGPDRDGNDRRLIRFHLVQTAEEAVEGVVATGGSAATTLPLQELRLRALAASSATQGAKATEARLLLKKRSQAVKQYVLARANGICELTGQPAPFKTPSGQPYLEVHHTRRLSDDGPDDPRWVAAITPTAHREIHYGANGEALNRHLQDRLKTIEPR